MQKCPGGGGGNRPFTWPGYPHLRGEFGLNWYVEVEDFWLIDLYHAMAILSQKI